MKKFYWPWMLVLCAIAAHAQSPQRLDSLRKVLAKLPAEGSNFASDTAHVKVMCEIALEMPFNRIDSTIAWLQLPLQLSKNINWAFGKCLSYYYIGYYYIGKNELMRGIDYLYQSLAIAEKNNLEFYIARNNKTLGDAYARLGNYNIAKKHLNLGIALFKKLKNKREELLTVNNLGLMFFEKKDYKASIPLFEYCLSENKKAKITRLDDIFFANLGTSLRSLGKNDDALEALEEAERVYKNSSNVEYRRILNFISIAELWALKGDIKKAMAYLQKVETMQKKFGTQVSQKDIYRAYYNLYKQSNDPKLALQYHEQYMAMQQKTMQQDEDQRIKNLRATFDNEKKTTEIDLLNQNIQQEALIKYILIAGAVLLLLFALWFWRNSQKLSKQNKTIENQRAELQSVNGQLETLNQGLEQKVTERTAELQQANESLIKKNEEITLALVEGQTIERKRVASELHDNLGATLSAINWRLQVINSQNLSEKERKVYNSILEMMKGAYSEVRLLSHNLLPAELEKGGLKGALEKFIADINSSGNLNITYNLQPEAIPTDKKMQLELYSIALELINNILKHAKAKNAHVALYSENQHTIFEISDDGIGIAPQTQSNGMGTKNIQNRVAALSGTISYLAQQRGTKFLLSFSTVPI